MRTTLLPVSAAAAIILAAVVVIPAQPAQAAALTSYNAVISGSGPTPLGQAIALNLDGTPLVAYGIDVTKLLMFGNYQASLDTVDNVANGGRAAWIYETYSGLANAGLAVQLAIWDVIDDGANGLDAGLVQLSPSAPAATRDLAASIIADSLGQTSSNAMIVRLTTAAGAAWQPLITSPYPPVAPQSFVIQSLLLPVPAPEPATWMLMAAGLALGRCYTRRK